MSKPIIDSSGEVYPIEQRISWLDPTSEVLETPEFKAIWNCIKSWDINVPEAYNGYCGANGNHVRAILDALRRARPLQ